MDSRQLHACQTLPVRRVLNTNDHLTIYIYIYIHQALAASGLRSVRFAREIPGLKNVITNDWSKAAVESIHRNVEHNKVANIITPRLD